MEISNQKPTKIKILNNGQNIPLIGLGNLKDENKEEIVYYSIKDGVRLIDTDPNLKNEEEIGKAIKRAIEDGLVKREDLFIIGKLTLENKSNPEKAIKETLKKLKLVYLDLYLDQWPTSTIYDSNYQNKIKMISIYDLWPKMEILIEKGLTKSIGVCNYNVQALNNLLSFCIIKPVVNGIEFHPFNFQKNILKLCEVFGITLLAYSPLAKGNESKKLIEEKANDYIIHIIDRIDNELTYKYGKTKGQIILNWHKQLGVIPIVSTSKINRMEENLEALEFNMESEDIKQLCSLGKKIRFNDSHKIFGYNILA